MLFLVCIINNVYFSLYLYDICIIRMHIIQIHNIYDYNLIQLLFLVTIESHTLYENNYNNGFI